MKRDCYTKLLQWKNSSRRKPLILKGARQVGKTYLLKQLGKQEFESCCYINFEDDPAVKSIFNQKLDPNLILSDLSIYLNQPIHPQKTLIIFDEIQECPQALTSLKYFNEKANEYFIVAAGSLLGVKLAKSQGFPVGKVNFIDLHPLTFFEFLEAINENHLRSSLENIAVIEPLSEAIHLKLINLLRLYFFIGGMPEAVQQYVTSQDLSTVREIQKEIIQAYLLDFSKHADAINILKISQIWHSIPGQLAKENKKFMYSDIEKKARAREYESALQWLIDAGLLYQSFNVSVPRQPLSTYIDLKIFKLFLFDIGLLGALSQLSPKVILQENNLFTEFKGALTENFVAQELIATSQTQLFYWMSKGSAELDFLINLDDKILPLEVKAGMSDKKKSLQIYADKYKPTILLRASLMNLKHDGNIVNFPLYMVGCISIMIKHK